MKCAERITAELHAEESNKDFKRKYCPAFGTKCKADKCHSFNKAKAFKTDDKDYPYEITKAVCLSPLVHGEFNI